MDDEEIERLIFELRAMLLENGFRWALDQADLAEIAGRSRRQTAQRLIDVTESVTIDLASSEIAVLDMLGVDDLEFRPDVESGDAVSYEAPSSADRAASYRVGGQRRREQLDQLTGYVSMFRELRARVDGLL